MNNDLISRSALQAEVKRTFDEFIHGAYFRAACDAKRAKSAIICILNDAPTVDAEPVRHGQNVTATHPSDLFVCSECGFSCEITEIRYEDGMGEPDAYEYDCKFCPDCGAKMDAEVEG